MKIRSICVQIIRSLTRTLNLSVNQDYGCDACHTIPGIRTANATVGPPLTGWAARYYISGRLANTPDNLIRWIQYPQAIEPGTAMPNIGVTDPDARDIAAHLYTLR